jgi:hypothetical protein
VKIVIYQVMRPHNIYQNFIATTGIFCFKTAAIASCSVKRSYALWIGKIWPKEPSTFPSEKHNHMSNPIESGFKVTGDYVHVCEKYCLHSSNITLLHSSIYERRMFYFRGIRSKTLCNNLIASAFTDYFFGRFSFRNNCEMMIHFRNILYV